MEWPELLASSAQAIYAHKVRSALTALGLMIGTASVILVVTVSLTGRDFILDKIRGIGSNLIYASHEAGGKESPVVAADRIKWADVEAVRKQLAGRIIAASGVSTTFETFIIDGQAKDLRVLGTDHYYPQVRNLIAVAGRFFDERDVEMRRRVCFMTDVLARKLHGSEQAAVGRQIKLGGLQFLVVGVFKESTSTMGQSELSDETVVAPYTISRYWDEVERVDPLYVQARTMEDVPAVTKLVHDIVASRHRKGANYKVENLATLLKAAEDIARILSLVLFGVSAIALFISGIGIMNIMLVSVTERTKEIGIRRALGATRRTVMRQFLMEAVLLSMGGGVLGILLGLGFPLTIRLLVPEAPIPISGISAVVAFGVSVLVGLIFGLVPAHRASALQPVEALRYE
jgi:putative ABC transport system permease protein